MKATFYLNYLTLPNHLHLLMITYLTFASSMHASCRRWMRKAPVCTPYDTVRAIDPQCRKMKNSPNSKRELFRPVYN